MASSNQKERLTRAVRLAVASAVVAALLATALKINSLLTTPQTDDLGLAVVLANGLAAVIAVFAGAMTAVAVAVRRFPGRRHLLKVAGPNVTVLVLWLAIGPPGVVWMGVAIFGGVGYVVAYVADRVLGCEGGDEQNA